MQTHDQLKKHRNNSNSDHIPYKIDIKTVKDNVLQQHGHYFKQNLHNNKSLSLFKKQTNSNQNSNSNLHSAMGSPYEKINSYNSLDHNGDKIQNQKVQDNRHLGQITYIESPKGSDIISQTFLKKSNQSSKLHSFEKITQQSELNLRKKVQHQKYVSLHERKNSSLNNRDRIKQINSQKLEEIKMMMLKNQPDKEPLQTLKNCSPPSNSHNTNTQNQSPINNFHQQINVSSPKPSDLNIIIKNTTQNNYFPTKNYHQIEQLNNIQQKYQQTNNQNVCTDISIVNEILLQYAKREQINGNILEKIPECISLIFNGLSNQLHIKNSELESLQNKYAVLKKEYYSVKQQAKSQPQNQNQMINELMKENQQLQNYIKEQDEKVIIYRDKESRMIKLLLAVQKNGVDIDSIYNKQVVNNDLDESDLKEIKKISKNKKNQKNKIFEHLEEGHSGLADQSILSDSQEYQYYQKSQLTDQSIIKAEYMKNFDQVIECTKTVIQNPVVKQKLQLNLAKVRNRKVTSSSSDENEVYNVVQHMGKQKKQQNEQNNIVNIEF